MIKSMTSLFDLFHLPLSIEAFEQFQSLHNLVQTLQLYTDPDQWHYVWGSNVFSTKKGLQISYGQFFGAPNSQMALEIDMPKQKEVLLLAFDQGQVKHERITKKEIHDFTRL
jgi:hypothetical protein